MRTFDCIVSKINTATSSDVDRAMRVVGLLNIWGSSRSL